MRILIDNTSFLPIVGGTETYCYQLISYFNPDQIDLQLLCQIPEEGPSNINEFQIIRVGDHGLKEGYFNGSQEQDASLGMDRLLTDKVDAEKSVKNLRKMGLEKYYSVIEQFNPDIVLVNDLMRVISVPFIQSFLLTNDIKMVINLHGILTSFAMIWETRLEKKKLALELILREDLPIYFIAPSNHVYDTALEWGIKEERCKLIYLGVDTTFFTPPTPEEKVNVRAQIIKKFEEKVTLTSNEFLIGFPSRAVDHKGIDVVLEALLLLFKKGPDYKWKLLIAGGSSDNPESIQETKELIDQFDMQERILVGIDLFLDFPKDMKAFYQACDLTLFPSRREALGYGALESMACGTAVIGTCIPGLSEALGVKVGETGECPAGWAVSPENPKLLVTQLESILVKPNILKFKGRTARKWVKERFNLERMTYEHLDFFEKISQQ